VNGLCGWYRYQQNWAKWLDGRAGWARWLRRAYDCYKFARFKRELVLLCASGLAPLSMAGFLLYGLTLGSYGNASMDESREEQAGI